MKVRPSGCFRDSAFGAIFEVMTPSERLASSLSGRYTIERELGAGGMATVYLARDLKHDRNVAVKVLRPELAAVIGAERFLAEIKTTANLQHPHILPLFDSGAVDGFLFYVMPYIQGISLRDRLEREKHLPIDDAIRLAKEIASALDYAHRQGVIHRDIKPENILLHDGSALVADFGIALAASKAGTRMTETGMSLGTPHYMSPEQAMGERELDARSDVYALGCVTYEMLTGDPPFTGSTAQAIVARVLTETPRAMTVQRHTIPAPVEYAVFKALEKLPADRFASAADFATALTSRETAQLTSVAPVRGGFDWRIALAAGVVLGAAAVWIGARRAPASSTDEAGQRRQLTFNGRAVQPAISPDGTFIAYIDNVCKHSRIDPCQATLMVQEIGSTRSVPALSGARQLSAPRWSHDGTTLVVAGQLDSVRSGLYAVPRLGGSPRSIGSSGAFDTHPSGDTVVSIQAHPGRPAEALFINLTTGTVIDSVALTIRDAKDVSWGPSGRLLAASTMDHRTVIFDRAGKETGALAFPNRPPLRWNVAGDAVLQFRTAPVKDDDLVRIPVSADGRITGVAAVVVARVQTMYAGQFDVARRTGRIVLATGDAIDDVWSIDLTPGKVAASQRTRGTTWYGPPTISPDGDMLAYFRGDALGDNVYTLSLKNGIEEALTTQRQPGSDAVHFSADGRRMVYGHAGEVRRIVEEIEFPSRKVSRYDSPTITSSIWPIGNRGFLDVRADGRALMVADSMGGAWRASALPDSLADIIVAPNPGGTLAAFLATTPDGATVFGTVPIAGGAFRVLSRLGQEPVTPVLIWDRDGTIYMARWLAADERPSLWKIAETTGVGTRVVTIPAPCDPGSVFVAMAHHMAACLVRDYRSDVWTIDGVGGKP